MPLVNYEGGSSDEDDDQIHSTKPVDSDAKLSTARRLHLPPPTHVSSGKSVVDSEESVSETKSHPSSNLLANLPKPLASSKSTFDTSTFPETELEDIVRGENKNYAKDAPQAPVKRKRNGPVKIFLPTIEQDSDDEDNKPVKKQSAVKRECALLNALPPPIFDEDAPPVAAPALPSLPSVKNPSASTPQITTTGLFIPYTLKKKQQSTKTKGVSSSNTLDPSPRNPNESEDEDDDDNETDFLGLTRSNVLNKIEVSSTEVENVLRETFPKIRPTVVQEAPLPIVQNQFEDMDEEEIERDEKNYEGLNEDDELLRLLPANERCKEIKHVHIDSLIGDSARLQLLKNVTDERETMLAQAAIVVPKGEQKKRAQITYLVAKAKHDDLQLKNMWSEQKLTKRQTQAKYGF